MASATADFERIYRRHARDVYRFALSVVRNPLEAEDVTQTTFLNAYRALERGDRPERPRSWLFAIAHNAIRSRDRWRLRRPPEVPLDVAEHRLAASPDEAPAVTDLFRALGDLPAAQREAITLRELQGQTYPEIAEQLGVSVSAVESLIGRARRALRAQRDRIGAIAGLCRLGEHGLAAKVSAVAGAAAALAGGMAIETRIASPPPAAGAAVAPERMTPASTRAAVGTPAAARPRRPAAVARAAEAAPPSTTAAATVASPAATVGSPAAAPPAPTTATTTESAATTTTETAVLETPSTTAASPAVTAPAVTAPAVTTPVATTPALTTPAVTTPAVTVPSPSLP